MSVMSILRRIFHGSQEQPPREAQDRYDPELEETKLALKRLRYEVEAMRRDE